MKKVISLLIVLGAILIGLNFIHGISHEKEKKSLEPNTKVVFESRKSEFDSKNNKNRIKQNENSELIVTESNYIFENDKFEFFISNNKDKEVITNIYLFDEEKEEKELIYKDCKLQDNETIFMTLKLGNSKLNNKDSVVIEILNTNSEIKESFVVEILSE